jgi:serine phosphatase RsbU (regulator of sigma subunit)/anti-sigma regulatory factor (Ser/Thr protein kinase)
VAFVPDYYPEKGRLFEPYSWWENGEIKHTEISTIGKDYTQNKYYKTVFETDAPMWTDPYRGASTGMNLVTYILPIHDYGNHLVAMFGLDVSVTMLGDTLNYRHVYPSSYDILLTKEGELLAAPDTGMVKHRRVEAVVNLINDSTTAKRMSQDGRCRIATFEDDNGERGYVYYASFKGTPTWQIAVVCYDREAFGKLRKMRLRIGLLMLLGLLVLGLIVSRFAKNDRKLQKAKLEQERLGSELRIARNIQMEMLPKRFPPYPDRHDIDIYGSLAPAKEVGGDLFDFFLRDEKLFFCIGDVSGKGVPSAMVMSMVHSLFRSASVHETNPSRIMGHLNEMSCEGNESNMFVTLFIGVLDLPTGRLRYSNAGHDKPLLVGDTVMELPAKANLPIGIFADTQFELQEYLLEPMTTIFLYTDGLTEAKNSLHKLFGVAKVKAVLEESEKGDVSDLLRRMTVAVNQFVEDAEQSDDLTMLAIRYTPKQEESVLSETLTLKNDPRQVTLLSSFVKDVLDRLDIAPKQAKEIRLAVEEVVVNVMEYAYPTGIEGKVSVQASSDGRQVKFVISDTGTPFDPTEKEKADTTLSIDERPIGGLGIHIVRQLMDSINYERLDGKNILTLWKKIMK